MSVIVSSGDDGFKPGLQGRMVRLDLVTGLNALAVGGISAVLVAAYGFQFAYGELPCPLCALQRVAFALAMVGFILNARLGTQPLHYAVVLASAGFGMLASGRQVLLHITPGTGHYGSAVFGLHFYTWAFILFAAMIPSVALLLALDHPGRAPAIRPRWVSTLCWVGVVVTLANAVTFFLQCGRYECADNPVTWWISGFFH